MIDAILANRRASLKARITVKAALSVAVVALAIAYTQLVHLTLGASGGVKWLPMYLPVIVGACVLGARWGVLSALLSPVVSFLITGAFSSPMPTAARLPFMAAELSVMALIAGSFNKLVYKNALWGVVAVFAALAVGRAFFMLLVVIFQSVAPFTPATIWAQIKTGIPGLIVNLAAAPALTALFSLAIKGDIRRD